MKRGSFDKTEQKKEYAGLIMALVQPSSMVTHGRFENSHSLFAEISHRVLEGKMGRESNY